MKLLIFTYIIQEECKRGIMIFHIKEAREKAGYSQKDLAKIIGVAPNTFYGYESRLHDPKSDLLVKIAIACHVSTDNMESPFWTFKVTVTAEFPKPFPISGILSSNNYLLRHSAIKTDMMQIALSVLLRPCNFAQNRPTV